MDALLRSSWAPVYQGNVVNQQLAVERYLSKYSKYIFRACPCILPQLDPQELANVFHECGPSAPGFDGYKYEDFKLLPLVAFQHLVSILQLIESGHPWPEQLLHTRAHMLSKDPEKMFDPLAYRLLLITPVL